MRPLNALGLVAALLVLVALAAACSSSSNTGSSSGGGSSSSTTTSGPGTTPPPANRPPTAAECASTKVRDLYTNGTIAQSVVQSPPGTKLLGIAVDHSFVVWTAQPRGEKPAIVCEASLASRKVTGIVRAPVASAPATTPAGVYYVTQDGTLWQVGHHGHRAKPLARNVFHGVAYDPTTGMIAYTDRADPGHNRITVLKTHPGGVTQYRRYLFPACIGTVCSRTHSVGITSKGVAWTQRPITGSFQGLVYRRSFTGQGDATHRIPRTPAPTLAPGFSTFAFSVKGGYDLWPLPAKHVTKAPKLTGQTLVAVGPGHFYTLRTTPQGVLLQAIAPNGSPRVLDNLSVLQQNGGTAQVAATGIGPTRICEVVNVYPTSSPAPSDSPTSAYVRCALLPKGSS